MTLRSKNGETQVHICSHDGQPIGVAHTAFVVLMDGGDGALPTNEEIGIKIMVLAKMCSK